jgi:hypothetical protein
MGAKVTTHYEGDEAQQRIKVTKSVAPEQKTFITVFTYNSTTPDPILSQIDPLYTRPANLN